MLIDGDRDLFIKAMQREGVPLKNYVAPLYRLPAFSLYRTDCPVADSLHDKTIACFDICAYSPTEAQLERIENAFHKVAEQLLPLREVNIL